MFAIAVATSSLNSPIRNSASGGSGSVAAAPIAPQSLPSTMIGAPAPARTPSALNVLPIAPLASA